MVVEEEDRVVLHIDFASGSMHHLERCLTTIETAGYFSVRFLPIVTSSCGFAFAGGGPAAAADFLVVGCWIVGEA